VGFSFKKQALWVKFYHENSNTKFENSLTPTSTRWIKTSSRFHFCLFIDVNESGGGDEIRRKQIGKIEGLTSGGEGVPCTPSLHPPGSRVIL
jgi:hypothetical protein